MSTVDIGFHGVRRITVEHNQPATNASRRFVVLQILGDHEEVEINLWFEDNEKGDALAKAITRIFNKGNNHENDSDDNGDLTGLGEPIQW